MAVNKSVNRNWWNVRIFKVIVYLKDIIFNNVNNVNSVKWIKTGRSVVGLLLCVCGCVCMCRCAFVPTAHAWQNQHRSNQAGRQDLTPLQLGVNWEDLRALMACSLSAHVTTWVLMGQHRVQHQTRNRNHIFSSLPYPNMILCIEL